MHWRSYLIRYEAPQNVPESISMFYHRRRLHSYLDSYLDYMSPNDFEQRLLEMKQAAYSKMLDYVMQVRLTLPEPRYILDHPTT